MLHPLRNGTLVLFLSLFTFHLSLSAAVPRVSMDSLNNGGYEQLKGQIIELTTPLIVCGTFYDSLILAPERLFVPEEQAMGLSEGDSTRFYELKRRNQQLRIKLECRYPYSLNLGATVKNLQARVIGQQHLQTGKQPAFKNYKPSKRLPYLGAADIVVCAANVQNYFVHTGGYATKRTTAGQHAFQCYKTAAALLQLNADLYALCELEQGSAAPQELVNKMNELSRKDLYRYVVTDTIDRDTISVGFLYRVDKIKPVGEVQFVYSDRSSIYAHRFLIQAFEQVDTHEQFIVSLNHPRSKRGNAAEANAKRVASIDSVLTAVQRLQTNGTYTDPDILFLGDYNSYRYEESTQMLVKAGYQDMLSDGEYSYSYKGEAGSLDRVYASPSMAAQITAVKPVHWNTDFYYSAAYYSKYNYKNRSIPKDAPKDIRRVLTATAKRNLLFRYSDHDPVLVGLKLGGK